MKDLTPKQIIRKNLKSILNVSSRQVSVRRTSGGSIRVEIKGNGISLKAVEVIASQEEEVSRCSFSGEILQGGNLFVFSQYSDDLTKPLVQAAVEIAEFVKQGASFGVLGYKCRSEKVNNCDGFCFTDNDGKWQRHMNAWSFGSAIANQWLEAQAAK